MVELGFLERPRCSVKVLARGGEKHVSLRACSIAYQHTHASSHVSSYIGEEGHRVWDLLATKSLSREGPGREQRGS